LAQELAGNVTSKAAMNGLALEGPGDQQIDARRLPYLENRPGRLTGAEMNRGVAVKLQSLKSFAKASLLLNIVGISMNQFEGGVEEAADSSRFSQNGQEARGKRRCNSNPAIHSAGRIRYFSPSNNSDYLPENLYNKYLFFNLNFCNRGTDPAADI